MIASADTYSRYRLILLAAIMVGCGLLLMWQLVRWQVIERSYLINAVNGPTASDKQTSSRRGQILDRQGHPLAIDTIEYQIEATPLWVNRYEDINEVISHLSLVLNISPKELRTKLSSDAQWVELQRHVPREAGERVRDLDFYGVHVTPTPRRGYPEGMLAAHLLGFVNQDRQGFHGVEGYYDTLLAFPNGVDERSEFTGTLASLVGLGAFPFDPAEIAAKGSPDLVLTVDRMIQHIAEQELEAAIAQHQATGGTVIVMDPRSGAILAMANRPAYEPEHFAEVSPVKHLVNPAITWVYEPGSVFKVVTAAAALDSGEVKVDRVFEDKGIVEVGGRRIYNWDRSAHGRVTITDAMALSLNTVMAQLSTELGAQKFYAYVQRFGFGRHTGIDLAVESKGQLKLPSNALWHESDLGTNAFGQGLAVTPLQMACAVAAIANDGTMMVPFVVAEVVSNGHSWSRKPTVARQVVSPRTAKDLTEILIRAAEEGAPKSTVPDYTIAGKSGTAEIPIPGGYDPHWTIASFAGFAPARDPQLLILVKVDRPHDQRWGATVAAPVFRNIAQRLFAMMDIPPDRE